MSRRPTLPVAVVVAAVFVSVCGEAAASLGLVLEAAGRGTPWLVTEVFFAGLVPPLLLAPLMGRVVDTRDPRTVWVTALLAQGACLLGAAAVVPGFQFQVLLISTANVAAVAASSAGFTLLPLVAPPEQLSRANGWASAAMSLGGLVGPAVGGSVHELLGVRSLYLGAAACYTVVAVLVARGVRVITRRADPEPATGRAGAREGLRVVRRAASVRVITPVVAGIILATSIEGVAGVFYLREVAGSDAIYGILLSAWALGSVPGSLVGGLRRLARVDTGFVVTGSFLVGGALLLEGLVPVWQWILVGFVVGGFGNGLFNVGMRITVHRHVEASAHGRAWAYYSVLTNTCVAVGYIAGTPTHLVPARPLVVLSGVLGLVAAVAFLWRVRSLAADRHPCSPRGPGSVSSTSTPSHARPRHGVQPTRRHADQGVCPTWSPRRQRTSLPSRDDRRLRTPQPPPPAGSVSATARPPTPGSPVSRPRRPPWRDGRTPASSWSSVGSTWTSTASSTACERAAAPPASSAARPSSPWPETSLRRISR